MKAASKRSWLYWFSCIAIVEIFVPAKYGLARASFIKSTIACEQNMMHLRCPHKSLVLKIFSARYGRLLSKRNICQPNDPNHVLKDCGEDTVTPIVQDICKMKSECSFTVNNHVLGEFCTNVYKYLVAVYSCVNKPTETTTTAISTTQATTTQTPTTNQTPTLFMNLTTSANSTMENSTSITTTTAQPVEFGWKNRRFTNKPNRPVVDSYDLDGRVNDRRNHGTSSQYVSGLRSVRNVGTSLLVVLLFDVFLFKVT